MIRNQSGPFKNYTSMEEFGKLWPWSKRALNILWSIPPLTAILTEMCNHLYVVIISSSTAYETQSILPLHWNRSEAQTDREMGLHCLTTHRPQQVCNHSAISGWNEPSIDSPLCKESILLLTSCECIHNFTSRPTIQTLVWWFLLSFNLTECQTH